LNFLLRFTLKNAHTLMLCFMFLLKHGSLQQRNVCLYVYSAWIRLRECACVCVCMKVCVRCSMCLSALCLIMPNALLITSDYTSWTLNDCVVTGIKQRPCFEIMSGKLWCGLDVAFLRFFCLVYRGTHLSLISTPSRI